MPRWEPRADARRATRGGPGPELPDAEQGRALARSCLPGQHEAPIPQGRVAGGNLTRRLPQIRAVAVGTALSESPRGGLGQDGCRRTLKTDAPDHRSSGSGAAFRLCGQEAFTLTSQAERLVTPVSLVIMLDNRKRTTSPASEGSVSRLRRADRSPRPTAIRAGPASRCLRRHHSRPVPADRRTCLCCLHRASYRRLRRLRGAVGALRAEVVELAARRR
jgi:hypothetical protein